MINIIMHLLNLQVEIMLMARQISDYVGADRTVTVSEAFSNTPLILIIINYFQRKLLW